MDFLVKHEKEFDTSTPHGFLKSVYRVARENGKTESEIVAMKTDPSVISGMLGSERVHGLYHSAITSVPPLYTALESDLSGEILDIVTKDATPSDKAYAITLLILSTLKAKHFVPEFFMANYKELLKGWSPYVTINMALRINPESIEEIAGDLYIKDDWANRPELAPVKLTRIILERM